jgi:hypothetical protein
VPTPRLRDDDANRTEDMQMAKGILLVGFDFTNAHEDEFHDWYDLEHVPERQRVPGFGACDRWISTTNPKHAVASYGRRKPVGLVETRGPYVQAADPLRR